LDKWPRGKTEKCTGASLAERLILGVVHHRFVKVMLVVKPREVKANPAVFAMDRPG